MIDYSVRKLLPARGPITISQFVRSKLNLDRHYMFTVRRQRRIGQRGNGDVEKRLTRKLAILRSIERAFQVIDLGSNLNSPAKFCPRLAFIDACEGRQAFQSEVHFRNRTLCAIVSHL